MGLPVNNTPVYTMIIPSSGKEVRYRPFLVKEEKALLIAQQSEDLKTMVNTLKEVISSCIKDQIDVDSLATFDLEYIFTQLRAKSVGEIIELLLKCDVCTDEKAIAPIRIDLTKLNVSRSPAHTNKIGLFDDVGVIMKYPSIELIGKLQTIDSGNIDELFKVISECIDTIYTSEEVFHAKEQTKQELIDFLNNLTSEQFMKVQNFFETMPKLKHDIEYSCPVCGKHHQKSLEGMNSFF